MILLPPVRYRTVALLLILIICMSSTICAQETEQRHEDTPTHRWSVGITGGWQHIIEGGSFTNYCGCEDEFTDATGSGIRLGAFLEYAPASRFRFSLDLLYNTRPMSASLAGQDSGSLLFRSTDSSVKMIFADRADEQISLSYLSIRPTIQVFPFETGLMVSASLGLDYLLSSNITMSRTLTDPNQDLTFENGTRTEVLEDEPISGVQKLGTSIEFALGYEFELSKDLFVMPSVHYLSALSVITYDRAKNWTANAVGASVSARLGL